MSRRRWLRRLAPWAATAAVALACTERTDLGTVRREELDRLRAVPYLSSTSTSVDSARRGVVAADPRRYLAGYNLFQDYGEAVYLMDMEGEYLHVWDLPGLGIVEYAALLADGDLLVVSTNKLLRLSWDSRVLFRRDGPYHHDVEPMPDGSLLALSMERRAYRGYDVWFDVIERISFAGALLESLSTWDLMDELRAYHEPSPLDVAGRALEPQQFDYYHTNAIRSIPDSELGRRDQRFRAGNWLLCSRHADLIYILDGRTHEVVWAWGRGELEWPHDPTLLPDGTIVVFDNGSRRGYSRVLRIDPVSGRIVWSYTADPPPSFYSPIRGAARSLPNGNVLITESEKAHAFEITPEGERVWDYYHVRTVEGERQSIYRMVRVSSAFGSALLGGQAAASPPGVGSPDE